MPRLGVVSFFVLTFEQNEASCFYKKRVTENHKKGKLLCFEAINDRIKLVAFLKSALENQTDTIEKFSQTNFFKIVLCSIVSCANIFSTWYYGYKLNWHKE